MTDKGRDEARPTVRMPSSQRRELLIEAGIAIAREEGGRAVSLARVAERCGVAKPIAYRLFGTLAVLLEEMQQQTIAEYEALMTASLENARTAGADLVETVSTLARSYVGHSLGDGAVYDAINAARVALEGTTDETFVLPERFVELATQNLGLSQESAIPLLVMFLGAADNLVAAVQAGVLTANQAVEHLAGVFTGSLTRDGGAR